MSAGVATPPPDEVVAVLAQTALLALVFAAIVLVTRALQVAFDNKTAERARQEAAQASQARIKTLADRNTFYCSDSSTYLTAPTSSATGFSSSSLFCTDEFPSRGSGAASTDCDTRDWTSGSRGSTCPTPPTAGGSTSASTSASGPHGTTSGGASSLLLAASSLLQRRYSGNVSGQPALAGGDKGVGGGSYDRSPSGGTQVGGTSGVWVATASVAGSGHTALRRKVSDSVLETSRVFGSVPQETITSTRTVLAAFNYDYSALHRREASYVNGCSPWSSRPTFKA